MQDPVEALILDLLEWIGPKGRPYREVIDAWRTSCPRLPVWEEAHDRCFIEHSRWESSEPMVSVSAVGVKFLADRRRRTNPGRPEAPTEQDPAAERPRD
jgi:hypothetical protein